MRRNLRPVPAPASAPAESSTTEVLGSIVERRGPPALGYYLKRGHLRVVPAIEMAPAIVSTVRVRRVLAVALLLVLAAIVLVIILG